MQTDPPPLSSPLSTPHSTPLPFPLTDLDLHLFNEGTHSALYEKLGSHVYSVRGQAGVTFRVWAPNARAVSVVGDFNRWMPGVNPLAPVGSSGIWNTSIHPLAAGANYKYHIESHHHGFTAQKADPFAFRAELRPRTASIIHTLDYTWGDAEWMASRGSRCAHDKPISIYELHAGAWRRTWPHGERPLTYLELAEQLPAYVKDLGFTHIELMPIMEHPLDLSWGYQCTGYFAPTARYGTPQDFMALIDALHNAGIGVILDWVPSHFPTDAHGLGYFDGTHLYEHADPREGFHQDWTSLIFNYGRHEVRAFLISSAMFWLDKYHVDGLRVDAVASMLYRDYSRREGEWVPNVHGGRENLEAIGFMRALNEAVYAKFPDVHMIAEESTAWGGVSRATSGGGLGFGFKWDMGWMHDTLHYLERDPIHRGHHHNEITFRALYQFSENYILPLSHDEVVHGKRSLIGRMPGDDWQKFANLRLLLADQWMMPGKKLLFQGGELGQWEEFRVDRAADWHLLGWPLHRGVQELVKALNRVYRDEAALHELDCDGAGFEWADAGDAERSTLAFFRYAREKRETVLVVLNFTPVPLHEHRVGVDAAGSWREVLNTDAVEFGGTGAGNLGEAVAVAEPWHGRKAMLKFALPPLGCVVFRKV